MSSFDDFTTPAGQVRLLISDLDEQNPIFNDAQINGYISLALDNNVKRAAASALIAIAVNEVLVQKRIKILDLSTDGPAQAAVLKDMAKALREEADIEEAGDAIGIAPMILNNSQFKEKLFNDATR